jgi:ubiquinone/menaquinone biosynthesis C-methylase UbiE
VTASHYIHGTTATEQARLDLLNRLHNGRCLDAMALAPGDRVIDFGSGMAQLACAMAERVGPTGSVVGVEREEAQLARGLALVAELGLEGRVDLRQGDVFLPPLEPDEEGTFDVAHARFVLEHVPAPLDVVRAMVRAIRPGGRVVLVDDDHDLMRFWPDCPEGEAVWRRYFESYRGCSNDPFVGRKLASLLHGAGCVERRFGLLDDSACHGDPAFASALENLVEVLRGAKESVIGFGADWDSARFDAALVALEAWGALPDATLSYAFCRAEGRRPEA